MARFAIRLLGLSLCCVTLHACSAPRPHAGAPLLSHQAVPLQYGYGGQTRTTFAISPEQWNEIRQEFAKVTTPHEERRAIAAAVQRLEQIAGEQTPVRHDRARNQSNPHGNGMTDCLDESANTTNFLLLLRQDDLLRHHEVLERVFRAPHVFDTHYSAAVREEDSGVIYVIDTWFHDHGVLPVVQNHTDWLRKEPLPAAIESP